MKEIIESGFVVRLPKATSFRFSECAAYKSLSGRFLKEMDVGWWDEKNSILILLELKGREIWDGFDFGKGKAHIRLMEGIKTKATDTLLILTAVWIRTQVGQAMRGDLPHSIHSYPGDDKIRLIFLIDTPDSRKSLLLPLKERINNELAGRIALFGIKKLRIVDFESLQKMGISITRV
jgi:hypothetical protein